MTELRKRMIECLQLRGLSERTQEAYVRAVRQLAEHYHKSPDLITEEELRQYFLHIKNVKKYSRASSTIAICGIKFFYEKTLCREFTTLKLVRAQREKKLPVILSVEEVLTILGRVRTGNRYRSGMGSGVQYAIRHQVWVRRAICIQRKSNLLSFGQLQFDPIRECLVHRHFVGVLEVRAHRHAHRDSSDSHAERL